MSSWPSRVLAATGADSIRSHQVIQTLWSGYGEIIRVELEGAPFPTTIVKVVTFPHEISHPRGWNTGRSHQRKVRSYQVEPAWYCNLANRCDDTCRVAQCYGRRDDDNSPLLILEDLDEAGYSERRRRLDDDGVALCLRWLAHFHSTFLHVPAPNLWDRGTYWHLDTRPDEWEAMEEGPLKKHASAIDKRLKEAPFPTLVHGDAKVANFCFSPDEARVAAVDFQYVGPGIGVQDVAYFLGSCLGPDDLTCGEDRYLDLYFDELKRALDQRHPDLDGGEVERAWRDLYSWAWADFHRFLAGWSPNHGKIHHYCHRQTKKVLEQLE